jgi:hypothetical protein
MVGDSDFAVSAMRHYYPEAHFESALSTYKESTSPNSLTARLSSKPVYEEVETNHEILGLRCTSTETSHQAAETASS